MIIMLASTVQSRITRRHILYSYLYGTYIYIYLPICFRVYIDRILVYIFRYYI